MPLVLGHEFAGTVEAVGANVEKSWYGKRVGVFPLIPCMECDCCKNRKYEMCKSYGYLGSRRDGGFAEFVAVPVWNLIELPDSVSMEQAAMLEPMAVAVHAIRQVKPSAEDTVVVMGLGTIGLLVVMFLLDIGMKNVYVIGNKDYQVKLAVELGARVYDGKRADVFFECVGKQESLVKGIDILAPSGKMCNVGNPHGDMHLDRDVYWKILRSQLTLVGTWNSSFTHGTVDDWHYVLDRLQQGKVHPEKLISHRYELEDIVDGFEMMRDKREEYGKVVMV
jgi:L-iditol 2-dehydrogenase